ncbi:hypothetical protein CBR_g976 [Chara braunii]|uniref:TCTP domain-containing protein n=1 Tax=Chara braunii TaxID=69332 RepID=A0A388KCS6_CHABU|nr:hypothetical protein CBR_g976 [Chara braunii]|eukprot:GBG67855.1 hypothetical protein CBR_g976 [Chara braunii]
MLLYTDIFTGDELLSDVYPVGEKFDGVLWEVKGKWIVKGSVDVDIGANPSAEGGDDEGVEDGAERVVDIVDSFRLQEQPSYSKKDLQVFLKGYMQKLLPKLSAERATKFKANAQEAVKYVLGKVKDLQFFLGESLSADGAMVFAYYEDGATDPTFLYFSDGLKEVKC